MGTHNPNPGTPYHGSTFDIVLAREGVGGVSASLSYLCSDFVLGANHTKKVYFSM